MDRIKIRIRGKGDAREVWLGKRLVGRLERREYTTATRGTDGDGRNYTQRKTHTRWRAWDPAGAALGELRSMAAWKRWFAGRASRKAVQR